MKVLDVVRASVLAVVHGDQSYVSTAICWAVAAWDAWMGWWGLQEDVFKAFAIFLFLWPFAIPWVIGSGRRTIIEKYIDADRKRG